MGQVKAFLLVAQAVVQTIAYVIGVIDRQIYMSRIEDIRSDIKVAQTGTKKERLEGGQKVEDDINRHSHN